MAEIVGIQLQVDTGNTEQSVGSLREQLRKAREDVFKISEEFGATSTEAANAAARAAQLADAIGDANALTEAFNPDRKFQAFATALNGVTGGFAAVQGGMALLGVESEEVEKTLLKVQAAMALSQGLNSVLESKDAFINLLAVLKQIPIVQRATAASNTLAAASMRAFGVATTETAVAFRVLRGAIMATGIGLLVVAIGLAVEAFSDFASAADRAKEAQERYNTAVSAGIQKATDAVIAQYRREEAEDIARAKAKGASQAEILAIETRYYTLRQSALRELYGRQKAMGLNALETEKQIEEERSKAFVEGQNRIAQQREQAEAKAEAARSDAAAKTKTAAEAEKQRIEKMDEERKERSRMDALIKNDQAEFADERAKAQQEEFAAESKRLDDHLDTTLKKIDANATAKENIAKRERDTRVMAAQITANALSGYAALAGEQTAAGKAFAIASATISTYLAATEAYASLAGIPVVGPALGAVAAGGAIAAGIANVRKILEVQVPGGGSSGGYNTPSLPNGSAPITPTAPPLQQQVALLNQQAINAQNEPVRAYVVEADISNSQDRINRIHNAASFK